jgi:hypothetical protein
MRIVSRFLSTTAVVLAAVALQACGGGGGGEAGTPAGAVSPVTGGGTVTSAQTVTDTNGVCSDVAGLPFSTTQAAPAYNSTTVAPPITLPAASSSTVIISGTATYEAVPYRAVTVTGQGSAGSLDYAATVRKPIRGVTIQAVNLVTNEVLATTTTSITGSYALNVPINTTYSLRVRAEMIKAYGPAQWNVSVLDNTANDALWVLEKTASNTTTTNVISNFNAATTWNGTGYTQASRPAGIFTMLDTLYTSMQQIASAQPAVFFPKLTVHWSPLNTDTASAANLATGQLGGKTFFRNTSNTTLVGGVSTTVTNRQIYVLGKADVDSDEFDSAILAHEFGHYLQNVFSVANVSLGGGHGLGNRLDMTLAFSEGWGNAYSSIARNDPVYADAGGPSQANGFKIDFGNTAAITNKGWFNEISVANSIYLLFTNAGFAPVWNALTGPMRTQASLPTIFSFAAAVRGAGVVATNTALNNVLTANLISTTSDEWGNNETNNGGAASNLPVYTPLAFNTATSTCYNTVNMTDATDINKLGMVKYHRHTLTAANAGQRKTRVNFLADRDVDFDVYQPGVRAARAANVTAAGGTTECKLVNLTAGEVVIRTRDFSVANVPTGAGCATLTLN